ncbi:hypothetical protein KR054_009934, partial [Drosophila jambulina]
VKVRKAKYVVFKGDVQGRRVSYSWCPLLGHVMIDVTGFVNRGTFSKGDEVSSSQVDVGAIVHPHTSRAVVDDDNTFVHEGDG